MKMTVATFIRRDIEAVKTYATYENAEKAAYKRLAAVGISLENAGNIGFCLAILAGKDGRFFPVIYAIRHQVQSEVLSIALGAGINVIG
jgi:hypothetical protein